MRRGRVRERERSRGAREEDRDRDVETEIVREKWVTDAQKEEEEWRRRDIGTQRGR